MTCSAATHTEVRSAARDLARRGLHGNPGDLLPNLMSRDAVDYINANLKAFQYTVSIERIIARISKRSRYGWKQPA